MIKFIDGQWVQTVRAFVVSETATRIADTKIVAVEAGGVRFVARVVTMPDGEKCPAYWNRCDSDAEVARAIADLVEHT